MVIVFSLIRGVVRVALLFLEICMFVRAILSWFQTDEESPLNTFVIAVTEPVIVPVRALLERFEFVASSPIDISFMVAFLLISILQMIL